jgi:hypothetical protein
MDSPPVFPSLLVPELNTSRPLTPAVPAFAVLIRRAPLVVPRDRPESSAMVPPVAIVAPAVPTTPPCSDTSPPVENDPSLAPPDSFSQLPPVVSEERLPAVKVTSPALAAAASVAPASTVMLPPLPTVPEPTDRAMAPPAPPVAAPEDSVSDPELPAEVVPVENTRFPLTPLVPAFGVISLTCPLEVAEPVPEETSTSPPVPLAKEDPPASSCNGPPAPLLPVPTVI